MAAVLLTLRGQVSLADVVTAFVPGKEWRASIALKGFQPFDVQLGPKTVLGGSTTGGITITVVIEHVKPGTTASEARAIYGPRYAGGIDEKEGVETTSAGDVAVIIYKNTIDGSCGFNGYLTKDDVAFDVHLSVDMSKQTKESVLAVLKSFKVENSPEVSEMTSLWETLTERDGTRKAVEREKALKDFVAKYPHNSWAQAILGEEYYSRRLYQDAVRAYSKALENHTTQPLVNPLYLWKCYDGLGVCLAIQGKYDQSLASLKHGYEVAVDLEDNELMAASSYNLACWYAESGRKKESIARLREAIRLNKEKRAEAQRDPSFKGLSKDPAFQALIARRSDRDGADKVQR